jgi:hypothetical protein
MGQRTWPLLTITVLMLTRHVTGRAKGWAVSHSLANAVTAAGLGGCTIPRSSTADGGPLRADGPRVLSGTAAPPWAVGAHWDRSTFLGAHGAEAVTVRLPAGQRQSGLLSRTTTIAAFMRESRTVGLGAEPGMVLGQTPASVLAATASLPPPSLLDSANLTSSVISLSHPGVGLPFHNHGAAWLTVVAGRKLVVLAPASAGVGNPAMLALQHQSPVSWVISGQTEMLATFEAAGLLGPDHELPLHCVLHPGETIYVPCNTYHATLNLDETLAFGGQQPARLRGQSQSPGELPVATPCPSDRDAVSNGQFVNATDVIRRALASQVDEGNSAVAATKLFALGEVLLQQCLGVAPLRLDAWLWRLRSAVARGDRSAVTEAAEQAAAQYASAVDALWMTALRAVSSLASLASSLPPSAAERILLEKAWALAAKFGSPVLDHPHRYGDAAAAALESTAGTAQDAASEPTVTSTLRDDLMARRARYARSSSARHEL